MTNNYISKSLKLFAQWVFCHLLHRKWDRIQVNKHQKIRDLHRVPFIPRANIQKMFISKIRRKISLRGKTWQTLCLTNWRMRREVRILIKLHQISIMKVGFMPLREIAQQNWFLAVSQIIWEKDSKIIMIIEDK